METSYTHIEGKDIWTGRLNYAPWGEGPTLVFLHEGLGCIGTFKDFPDLLCRQLGINGLVYDRLGYGQSSDTDGARKPNYLEREALYWLPAVLATHGITHPILYGHSDGGTIALLYAAHHKPLALVTEAAHAKVEDVTISGIKQALKNELLATWLKKHHGHKVNTLLADWGNIWLSAGFSNWNIEPMLAHVDCPALILQGADDEYASPQHMYAIAHHIGPKATPVLIKDAGHILHRQARDVVLAKTTSFLSALLP